MKDIALHILDIAQNGLEAGANRIRVYLINDNENSEMLLKLEDNGKGMNADQQLTATDPFFTSRTTRSVGLGLPLLNFNANSTGGGINLRSIPGEGTSTSAWFNTNHLDCVPLGDIAGTFMSLIGGNPQADFLFCYVENDEEFILDTEEIKDELDELDIINPKILAFIREMIEENIKAMRQKTTLEFQV